MMVWFRWPVLCSLSSCVALRVNEAAARVKEKTGVQESVKKYEVRVGLSLNDPYAETGSAIDIAVNGVRRLTRTSPTEPGRSMVLQHIRRGHVVTAYVHAFEDACAYWVGAGTERCTVGGWNLSFAISDEGDQTESPLYDAYVDLMGMGNPVTVEVNYAVVATYAAQPNELLVYPGLQKGTRVQVSCASGDACTYLAGDEKMKCFLDESWGMVLGSEQSYFHANDEGVHDTGNTKNYTVDLALEPEQAGYAKVIEIELNGHGIARKTSATEEEKNIVVHHVKSGSVLTAVSHLTGRACGIYISAGMRTKTCAGWKLNLNIQEENEGSFGDQELFDVTFSVSRWSTEQNGDWKITANGVLLVSSAEPHVTPVTWGGWSKGTRVVPWVNDVPAENCAHEVGQNTTSCDDGGWFFSIQSQLNMNSIKNDHHWDWEVDDTSDSESDADYEGDLFGFSVTATDSTGSKSKLECVARENLEFIEAPFGEKNRKISVGKTLFNAKDLIVKTHDTSVKTITFTGDFKGEYDGKNGGFICTVYDDDWEKMCEADTSGKSTTMVEGCTLVFENEYE